MQQDVPAGGVGRPGRGGATGARGLALGSHAPSRPTRSQAGRARRAAAGPAGLSVYGHGLRLDGTIQDPTSGELVWFDVSVVHTTSRSHLKAEAKFSRERRAAYEKGAVWKSAALMEAYQGKLDRYALLAAMVERQVLGGRRTAPLILPVVVTMQGEFCPGTVQLPLLVEPFSFVPLLPSRSL